MRSLFAAGALLALALCFASPLAPSPSWAGPLCECGDGIVCGSELCDDANTVPDDECSLSCLPRVCGDRITNPDPGTDEECDDGNTTDDDGCTDSCQNDCGDGETDAGLGETCDEGNDTNGDGCDDDTSTTPLGNCTITACGNGVITAGEECDPPGKDCDETCEIPGDSVPTPPGWRRCVSAVNKSLARVARAQNQDAAKCVKAVAAGDSLLGACLGQDATGKLARAKAKTAKQFASPDCQEPDAPGFALTDAPTVNGAGDAEMLESLAHVLGDVPVIADRGLDAPGARCQNAVLEQHALLVARWFAEANRAKKSALRAGKGGVPPEAEGPSDLAERIDAAVAASVALPKLRAKAGERLAKRCSDAAVDALFDCGGATSVSALTACVIESAEGAACDAFEVADNLHQLTCPGDPPG